MDKNSITKQFKAVGLSRLTKDIDHIALPSIRLLATPTGDESSIKAGASKLGGMPDLPPGVKWPAKGDIPHSFIAQINLAEASVYDMERLLPKEGILWFFYDANQETYGTDPEDHKGWQVFYQQEEIHLQRAAPPDSLPAGSRFKACSFSFRGEYTLTQFPRADVPNYDWTEDELHRYEALQANFPDVADRAAAHHRMLGFADAIQDDMRPACQLISHGVTDASDPRAAALSKDALNWQLLLQIDSDDRTGMEWENNGMLYYWIQRADLLARNFGASWLFLEAE